MKITNYKDETFNHSNIYLQGGAQKEGQNETVVVSTNGEILQDLLTKCEQFIKF